MLRKIHMQKDRGYVSNSCQIQTVIKTAWNVSETFELHKMKLKTWSYQKNLVKLLSYSLFLLNKYA